MPSAEQIKMKLPIHLTIGKTNLKPLSSPCFHFLFLFSSMYYLSGFSSPLDAKGEILDFTAEGTLDLL